jgi:hypothetical protein
MSYSHAVRVTPEELRRRFNEGYYWERAVLEGEFEEEIVYEELASEAANQPTGTLSQEIIYHSGGQLVARVHQYLLPGDERDELGRPRLGGSGMPNPKELIEDGVWYHLGRARRPRW